METQADLEIVGEAATGEAAIRLAQELIPDVVLMDLVMAGMTGVEATRQIKRLSLRTQIIVLTSYHEDDYIFSALRAGALSYVLKDVRSTELADIVRKAAQGEAVLHSTVAARLIQEIREAKPAVLPAFADLTPREIQVLCLLAEGCSNGSIAEKLVLSEKTIKGHVSNILSKLHIEDRTQAAVFAWQYGLMKQ